MGSSSIFNHLAQIAILTDSSLEETRHHQGKQSFCQWRSHLFYVEDSAPKRPQNSAVFLLQKRPRSRRSRRLSSRARWTFWSFRLLTFWWFQHWKICQIAHERGNLPQFEVKTKNFWNHRSWLIFVEPLEMNEPDTRRPAGAYVFT